jgi:hypothetical protein
MLMITYSTPRDFKWAEIYFFNIKRNKSYFRSGSDLPAFALETALSLLSPLCSHVDIKKIIFFFLKKEKQLESLKGSQSRISLSPFFFKT